MVTWQDSKWQREWIGCDKYVLLFPYALAHIPFIALAPGGGGDSTYERGGDARRKFGIKPLKETDLEVAQAFFDP